MIDAIHKMMHQHISAKDNYCKNYENRGENRGVQFWRLVKRIFNL